MSRPFQDGWDRDDLKEKDLRKRSACVHKHILIIDFTTLTKLATHQTEYIFLMISKTINHPHVISKLVILMQNEHF